MSYILANALNRVYQQHINQLKCDTEKQMIS